MGAIGRMEMTKVPENGYKIIGLWISGIKRKFNLSNLLVPLKILCSLIKSYQIIKQFKPDFVIETGGFVVDQLFMLLSFENTNLNSGTNSFPGLTTGFFLKK